MNTDMDGASLKLHRLHNEFNHFSKELEREIECNRELQNQLISCKNHNDKVCAMMSLLRTETEAVITRHNIIMKSPEARAQSKEILLKSQSNYMNDEDGDEMEDLMIDNDAEIEEGENLTIDDDDDILEDEQRSFDSLRESRFKSFTSVNAAEESDSFDDDLLHEADENEVELSKKQINK